MHQLKQLHVFKQIFVPALYSQAHLAGPVQQASRQLEVIPCHKLLLCPRLSQVNEQLLFRQIGIESMLDSVWSQPKRFGHLVHERFPDRGMQHIGMGNDRPLFRRAPK
jgi:hypothetical protein